MIPVLFKGNETNFNHNGIGLLKDTLSCEVSEVRNGSFDLELVYPITGPYFKDLKNGNIIQAKPNDTDLPHNFRITEIDKTLSDKEVVVYGVSITNDLGGNMVKSLYLEDVTPQVILNEMKKVLHYPTTFNFVSNITTIGSVDWELNNPLNLIVGEEGSLVDIFGGEVKRTNDTLFLYGRRGKDNVTTIRAGKNLDGFKMTESFQGKYTQILPYFKYEEEVAGEMAGDTEGETIRQEVTVFGSIVSSPYHGRYPVNSIKPVDFSQNETVREAKTLKALNAEAARYFSDLYSEIDKPSVNINVDMIQLVDSEQYELYEKLEKIELTDTVSVYIPEYDVDVLVKVTELKYDSLRERTISIVAGSSGRTSLMDEISGSYKQFTKTLVDDKIQSATSGIINQILTKKDGGNVYAGRATPPDNAKKGDIWFKDTGGGDVELYEFDGVNWIRKMYKGFGDDVRQLVDSKIAEANVTITEALEEHDNTIAQAMTKAGQANDLAQQAKTEAANASLSASRANQEAEIIKNDLNTAKTNLQNQVNAAQADANSARTDINQQAKTILAQAQAQTALTSRVTTVETLADGTKTTVAELSKTVNKATGDITSVTNRTKVVEDGLSGVKTNYTQLSQTVNTQTGQIQTINSKTADLQSGIDGVTERFENLQVGNKNYLPTSRVVNRGCTNFIYNETSKSWSMKVPTGSTTSFGYGITFNTNDLNILLNGGETLFFGLMIKANKACSFNYDINNSLSGSPSNDNDDRSKQAWSPSNKSLSANVWTRVWFSYTAKDNVPIKESNSIFGIVNNTSDVDIEIKEVIVAKSKVPVDYQSPEEDTALQIAEYKRTADQNYSGLQSTVSTLDGKVTQNKTAIDQTSREIALKASATDVNNLTGRMSTAEGKITTQAGQIALKAEKTYVDTVKQTVDSTTSRVTITEQSITSLVSGSKTLPDGRTSVFATKIESLEGAITQRVTTQELNNRGYQNGTDVTNTINSRLAGYVTNQTYTTYTTARQQTDQQITEQINQTVSKVPTGPVNLVINGFDPQTVSPWTSLDTTNWTLELTTHGFFYNSTKKLMRFKTSTATTKGTFESNIFNLKRNTKYTIRVGIFANSNCKELRFCFGRGTATSISDYSMAHAWFIGSTSKLEYKTITVDSGNYDYGKLTFDHNGTKTVGQSADMYIAEISIIEGEYNNSWTPSFDELITEQKFNETKSTVDAFSRAIGTRDETGFVPNIARLVMTQDSVISEVAKYGDHNNNLIVDAVSHSQTIETGGASIVRYPLQNRIDFSRSGATTNVYAGISCKLHVSRFITGEKYTLSFDYYLHSAPDSNLCFELKDGVTTLSGGGNYFASPTTPTGAWSKHTVTFVSINSSTPDSNNIRLLLYSLKNSSVAIKNIMLVRGDKIGTFSPSQVDSVSTRVEQTANSYSIKFLNNANDITTQLNLTNSGTRIKSSLIHLDGNVTVSGTAWMDGAVIKNLSADKITTGTLNANNVNITNLSVNDVSGITATYLQSVIGTAFIDWMKGKVIQGYNNNMTIDLLGGNITLNSGSNAIKRVKGTHTAFVHFNDVSSSVDGGVGSIYASIGVTSSGDGVDSMSSGRFTGLRVFRAASGTAHNATIDQTEIYGDKVVFKDDFTLARGFIIRPVLLDRLYDLNDDVLNPIRFFVKLLHHLNNVGWNWQERAFIDALVNEWNTYGMSRYGNFKNNKVTYP